MVEFKFRVALYHAEHDLKEQIGMFLGNFTTEDVDEATEILGEVAYKAEVTLREILKRKYHVRMARHTLEELD